MERHHRTNWLRRFVIALLVFVVPFATWFVEYGVRRAREEEEHRYLVMNALARRFEGAVLVNHSIVSSTFQKADPDPHASWVRLRDAGLDPVGIGDVNRQVIPVPILDKGNAEAAAKAIKTEGTWAELWRTNREYKVLFEVRLLDGTVIGGTRALSDLISWKLGDAMFDAMVMLEHGPGDGTAPLVVARHGPLPGQLDGEPIHCSQPTRSREEARSGSEGLGGGPEATSAKEHRQTDEADASRHRRGSGVGWDPLTALLFNHLETICVGSDELFAFRMPVRLEGFRRTRPDVSTAGAGSSRPLEGAELELVGLVSRDRLRRDTLYLSPLPLSVVATIAALLVLALPWMKLRFMARRERAKALDLWWLILAGFAGTALVTLVLTAGVRHLALRAILDDELGKIANQVQTHVTREADEAIAAMREARSKLPQPFFDSCGSSASQFNEGLALLRGFSFGYPSYEAIFCTDTTGRQLAKVMPRTVPTPLVSVDRYPYFKGALAAGSERERDGKAFFDAVSANTSGRDLAIFALPFSAKGRNATYPDVQDRTGIFAIATPFHSLNGAVVPAPFSFLVVDLESEDVSFFSDGVQVPRKYFFRYVEEEGARLQELARGATAAGTRVDSWRFLGTDYRVQVFGLPKLSESTRLLVRYDERILDEVDWEVLRRGYSAIGLLCLLGLVAGGATGLIRPNAYDWIWPTRCRGAAYVFGTVVAAVAGLVPLWLEQRGLLDLAGASAIAVALVIGMGAGLSSWHRIPDRLLARAIRGETRHRRISRWLERSHGRLYVVFVLSILFATAVVPSFVVASAISRELYVAFMSTELAKHAAEEAHARRERGAGEMAVPDEPGEALATEKRAAVLEGRQDAPGLAGRSDLLFQVAGADAKANRHYEPGFYELGSPLATCDSSTDPGVGQQRRLDQRCVPARFAVWPKPGKPIGERLAAEIRACSHAESGVAPGSSTCKVEPAIATIPSFVTDRQNRAATGAIAGIVTLALAILAWLVRDVGRSILGLEIDGDGFVDRRGDLEGADLTKPESSKWLLLRPPADVLERLRERLGKTFETIVEIDLSRADLADLAVPLAIPDDQPVLLLRLESRLASVRWSKVLSALLARERRAPTIVGSLIDPLYWATERWTTRERVPASSEEEAAIAAWAAALRGFEKARFRASAVRVEPGEGGRRAFSTHADELQARIDVECQWSDPLREIGAALKRRSDLDELSWSEIREAILDAAEPWYRELWLLCSEEEKLLMVQLAQEGVVNPRCGDVLRRLRRRQLIHVTPRFRLMNESFREFVLDAESRATIAAWETPGSGGSWSAARVPVIVLLCMLLGITALMVIPQLNVTVVAGSIASVAGAVSGLGAVFARVASFWGSSNRGGTSVS